MPRSAPPVAPGPDTGAWEGETLDAVLAKFQRVLLVDDSKTLADMLAMFFQIYGFDARTAYDGDEAIAAIAESVPDIAFIDLEMPGTSGLEVARRARALQLEKVPVLVALTGWEDEAHKRQAREAGFDHFLAKPVAPSSIREFMSWLAE